MKFLYRDAMFEMVQKLTIRDEQKQMVAD